MAAPSTTSWRGVFSRLSSPRTVSVGLEVGTSTLKVVELRAGVPPQLQAFGLRAMPPGVIQDDQIVDTSALAEELRALMQGAGITKRLVATAVGNRLAITRNIRLPKMPLRELEKAIPWEAERYIPFPIAEVAFDYYVLDNPSDVPDGGEIEVVVVAARLDMVTQLVAALKKAGLEPSVIDIKPFALLRALRGSLLGERFDPTVLSGKNYTEDDDIGVVVEVAASSSTITLVRGERVVMNRNLGVAGDDFTTALQRSLGLDFDSAEALKLRLGNALTPASGDRSIYNSSSDGALGELEEHSAQRVHEALRPVVSDLTTEIRRSLEFFRVQSGDANISRMLLAGGGAKLRGLPEAVSRSLGFRVEFGNPWLTVLPGERFEVASLEPLAPEFGVPLGLALRGVQGRG